MKKTYYQKTFNICVKLFILGIIFTIGSIVFYISIDLLQGITYLTVLTQFLTTIYIVSALLAFLSILIFILLVGREISLRIEQDSLTNLLKSIWHTITMRQFLTKHDHSKTITTVGQVKTPHYNSKIKLFNKAIQKTVVDIREDKVVLLIRVPKTQEALDILNNIDSAIHNEISNRLPDYYFSQSERQGNYLYFIGTKRK
ncbi:hypothetical protein [Streptococcus sp. sy004]|uniref:hypothetical protein n=1 Tax=Streptococcus sp. sy004 TaxID=2600149 RepID=UPI0011B7C0CA|nr:hypothetical protein [Streptococcus sp. sy004]TWT11273.1 hypothetical protein FRX54_03230 [Streptococcus sp. sy004]